MNNVEHFNLILDNYYAKSNPTLEDIADVDMWWALLTDTEQKIANKPKWIE